MADLDEPSDVADQVDMPGVADSQAGPGTVSAKLALVDHLA
jgi:hypothetical protein